MGEETEFDKVVSTNDPEGEMKTRMLQEQGRVDIPEQYHTHHDIDVGDDVLVVCGPDCIKIMRASLDVVDDG